MLGLNFGLFLIVGLAAGWLASLIMGARYGLLGDLGLGVAGAFIGGYLFTLLGLPGTGGILGAVAVALFGAVALLALIRLVVKADQARAV